LISEKTKETKVLGELETPLHDTIYATSTSALLNLNTEHLYIFNFVTSLLARKGVPLGSEAPLVVNSWFRALIEKNVLPLGLWRFSVENLVSTYFGNFSAMDLEKRESRAIWEIENCGLTLSEKFQRLWAKVGLNFFVYPSCKFC